MNKRPAADKEEKREDTIALEEQVRLLRKEVSELNEWRKDRVDEDARKEQRIIDLELTLRAEGTGRRDYNFLSTKLMREIMRRKRCMDYRDIVGFAHFKTDEEAYRLMNRTEKNYPQYVEIRKIKKGRTTKKVICRL